MKTRILGLQAIGSNLRIAAMPDDPVSSHLVFKCLELQPLCVWTFPEHARDPPAALRLSAQTKRIVDQH